MTDIARAVLDATIARDSLKLPPQEYERLLRLYAETRLELAEMRADEYRYVAPDCTSPP